MNKKQTFFTSAKTTTKVFIVMLAFLVVFGGIELSFFLLNLASTLGNIVGFLLLGTILTFTFSTLFAIAKYYNEDL